MKEMMRCPFCGYPNPHVKKRKYRIGWNGIGQYVFKDKYSARCGHCFARGPLTDSEEKAIMSWNKSQEEKEQLEYDESEAEGRDF